MPSEPIGSPVVDSVSGGFSKRLVGFAKRPLYDDHYVGIIQKLKVIFVF